MTSEFITFGVNGFYRIKRFVKTKFPIVRRRQLVRSENRRLTALNELIWLAPLASEALIAPIKPVDSHLTGEICLFVTFGNTPHLKTHVRDHLEYLLGAGLQVVLIVNSNDPKTPFRLEASLANRLAGIYLRDNVGFDFAAWAHLIHLMPDRTGWKRLFLINDSVIGPLGGQCFDNLMGRIRASAADFVGLTQNSQPIPHLQSFFMVFNLRALEHPFFQRYFARLVSLARKETVIDVYETRLTQSVLASGLTVETLFPSSIEEYRAPNSTTHRWMQLLSAGFPYIKTSVIRESKNDVRLKKWVPARYLDEPDVTPKL